MDRPLISVIIGHYDKDRDLARLLRCLARQTYPNVEVIVTVDGDPPKKPFLWYGKPTLIVEVVERYGAHMRIVWAEYPRQASDNRRCCGCFNDGVHDHAQGELICVLAEDWWLEDAWIEKMADSLLALGPGNHMCGIMKNRRHQLRGGWPYEAHIAPLPNPDHVDSGSCSMVFKRDWINFDEDWDEIGAGHYVPFWGHQWAAAGHGLWYNSTVIMKHRPHPTPVVSTLDAYYTSYELYCKKLGKEMPSREKARLGWR